MQLKGDRSRKATLFANYSSSFLIGIAIGGIIPFLSLVMENRGVTESIIGANTAVASLGIICTAPFVPSLVSKFGLRISIIGGVSLSVICFIALAFVDSIVSWFLLRPLIATGTAVHWIISETWLNAISTRQDRGRIMAIYVTTIAAGCAVGPILLTLTGIDGLGPFIMFAFCMGSAAIPLIFVAKRAPVFKSASQRTIFFLAKSSPTIVAAVVAAGLYAGSCFAFLPIFGLRMGLQETNAVFLLTSFLAGNLIFQIPVGWLADFFNQRVLLLGCSVIAIIVPLFIPMLMENTTALFIIASFWGGAVFAFYTIGVTMLGERFQGYELTTANASFIMIFEIANMLSPPITGVAMQLFGSQAMMSCLTLVALVFLVVLAIRPAEQ